MEKICKSVKEGLPERDPAAYADLVKKSTHFCRKCGLCANDKKRLCKPEKIPKKSDRE